MTIYHFFSIAIIILAIAILTGMRQIGNITLKQAIIFVGYGFIGALIWVVIYMIIYSLPFVAELEHRFPLPYIMIDVFITEAFLIEFIKDQSVHRGVESGKIPIQTVFDAVVFGALVGIGFGVVENIADMILEPNPDILFLFEEAGLVLNNIVFGSMMGYYIGMSHFYKSKGDEAKGKQMFIAGLMIPSVLHGIPNFLEELVEHHMIPEWGEWLAVAIEAVIVIVGICFFFKWKRTMIKMRHD